MLLSLLTHNSTTLTNTNTRHDWHGIFAFWIFTSNEKKPPKNPKTQKNEVTGGGKIDTVYASLIKLMQMQGILLRL